MPASVDQAFATFVDGIDRWWPVKNSITRAPQARVTIEARAGGRWYEESVDGERCDWGRGYVGFATAPGPTTDIENILGQDGQNFVFIANQRVVEAPRSHGADDLDIRPYDPSEFD